ncbi:hypothetical protein EHQ53_16155 [Leptospira langatensis]|uniref:Fibronectin type-III domain-containing protein n=1 Tax=Leptospira langatensis TaxID=2484983 RepID=A0A5F1ZPV2_9LEPT|nr:hypothetical protein [Leptospira langatensis]TGK05177.1 hypothetical protein EHO57_00400 [Leptospira langatensis]TGL38313.1 hypothetical protein EHQ53_16155 [Leptospira langatensis]
MNPFFALFGSKSGTGGGGSSGGGGNGGGGGGSTGVPSWVSASDASSADKVDLQWEPIAGAQFDVMRKSSTESSFQKIATTTDTTFSDTSLDPGKTYQYSIRTSDGTSTFDTGWKAFSAGCATQLNPAGLSDSQFSRLKYGLSGIYFAVANLGKFLLVANGGRVTLLNENKDVIGVWANVLPVGIVTDSSGNIFATSNLQLLKLKPDCSTQTIATLPGDAVPTDLVIDSSDNLYISEANTSTGTDRIFKYDTSGNLLTTYDIPGVGHRPMSIVIQNSDNTLLVADQSNFDLVQYSFNADQLDLVVSKPMPVIGTVLDLDISGGQILLVVKSNSGSDFGPNITRFHSGINGGSVTFAFNPQGLSFNTAQVQNIAVDSLTGALYILEGTTSSVYSCPPSIFINCSQIAVSAFPVKTVRDTDGNFYILHASPLNYISKLNSNGAHIATFNLPKYQGASITAIDMEIDQNFLYVSANNNSGVALAKIKTDFTSSSINAFKTDIGFDLPNIAISENTIYNDVHTFGDTNDFLYIGSMTLDTQVVHNYSDATYQKFFMQQILDLETDYAGNLYSLNNGFNEDFSSYTAVSKFDLNTLGWVNIADSANLPTAAISTDRSGNLYTVDLNSTHDGWNIVQRGSDFTEKKRLSVGPDFTASSLYVNDAGDLAFMTTSDALHKFAFPVSFFSFK